TTDKMLLKDLLTRLPAVGEAAPEQPANRRELRAFYINESGVCSLADHSNSDAAQEFKTWVKTELIPATSQKGPHQLKHRIKALDYTTGETVAVYDSLSACGKDLDVNPGMIKMIAERTNKVKSAISRTTDRRFRFAYTADPVTRFTTRAHGF